MPAVCTPHQPLRCGEAPALFRLRRPCSWLGYDICCILSALKHIQSLDPPAFAVQCPLDSNDVHSVLLLYCLSKAAVLFGVRLQVRVQHTDQALGTI